MPKTQVHVQKENFYQEFQYIPDSTQPNTLSLDFIKADYLDHSVAIGILVLYFLRKQQWVDSSKLIIVGHSPETKVATKLAKLNQASYLELFAPYPFGRIDQSIRQVRLDAQLGKRTWEEADSIINQKYEFYQSAQDT